MSVIDDPQVEHVLQAVETMSGGHDRSVTSLQKPLATFGGKTALELIAEGRTDAAVR